MTDTDRRCKDNNGDWNAYRIFVVEEMRRQGIVQLTMLKSIEEINGRLIAEETKMRTVAGLVALTVSSIVSLISAIIIFIIERVK